MLTHETCVGHLVGADTARDTQMSKTQRLLCRFTWFAQGGVGDVQTGKDKGLQLGPENTAEGRAQPGDRCGGVALSPGRRQERRTADRGLGPWPGLACGGGDSEDVCCEVCPVVRRLCEAVKGVEQGKRTNWPSESSLASVLGWATVGRGWRGGTQGGHCAQKKRRSLGGPCGAELS